MRILTISTLLIIACGFANADRLNLKDGSAIEGTYLGGSARQIRFEGKGGMQTYEVGQIRSISFVEDSFQSSFPPAPSQAPPQPRYAQANQSQGGQPGITLPADTQITIRMVDAVNSQTTRVGQTFRATVDEPVVVADQQVIPRGADVVTKLVDDQKSGKIEGRTALTLALVSISVNGQMVDVTSTDVRTASGSRGAKSAGLIGGGAAVGAIVGALAGGGKGAAIGAASGGALGGATTVLMKGQEVKIPSETRLTFRLQYSVQL